MKRTSKSPYALALALFACACSTTHTWTSGGESDDELRAILARRDGIEAGLATPEAIYLIPRDKLAAETDALLKALHASAAEPGVLPYDVGVEFRDQGVIAYDRPQVYEIAYEDGALSVRRFAGQPCHVAFARGNETLWMKLTPSENVDAAWSALAEGARREARGGLRIGPGSGSPLGFLRRVSIDYGGIDYGVSR